MSRHRNVEGPAPKGRAWPFIWIAVGAAVCLLAIYGLAGLVLGDDDPPDQGTLAVNTSPSADDAALATDAPTSQDADVTPSTASPSPSPTTTAPSEETAEGAALSAEDLSGCQDELRVAQTAFDAGAVSANNWRLHYEASEQFNAGEIDIDEADAIWAETKADGAAEVESFGAADAAYRELQGACASLTEVTGLDSAGQAVVKDCAARGQAASAVAESASAVNDQWAEHVEMMASKADFDPDDYLHEWHKDVAAAPPVMAAYDEALTNLAEAPACSD